MHHTQPLFVQGSGPQGAPTLLFLHGGGGEAWMWQPVISRLPEYHCLAVDLPEHGQSRAVAPFRMASAAEQVAQTLRAQAHGGKATVIGLSEGAQVAVQLLATAPELVEKALISSALLRPMPGMGWVTTPAMLKWTYRLSIPPFRDNDWWIRINMKYATGIPDEYFPAFKKSFQETTESQFVNLMHANQTFRLPPNLSRASAPSLILAGKKEYGAMKQSARDLVAALPNARGGLINLGKQASLANEHNWALAAPDLFAQTVRAWVEGTALPKEIESL